MKTTCIRYWLAVAFVSQVFLFSLPVAAQVGIAAGPPSELDLKTSLRGSLQQRLQAAFPDSFEVGVEVFWEPVDPWLSKDVLDWWALRVPDEDFAGVTPEAGKRLLWRISGESPVFSKRHRRRLCAVVGASGNLLGSRYGKLIDAHEVVFRVNRAPTDSFDSDVGERTTHHVMWPRDLEKWEYDRQAFLLMTPIAVATEDIFDRILTLTAEGLDWDPGAVRIIHPEFVKYLHEKWTAEAGIYPSTGFIAMMIALHVCDEVNVFGFGADSLGRWDRYYEDDPQDVSSFHPADFEGRLRDEMEIKGLLKVFRGNRPDPGSSSDTPPQE